MPNLLRLIHDLNDELPYLEETVCEKDYTGTAAMLYQPQSGAQQGAPASVMDSSILLLFHSHTLLNHLSPCQLLSFSSLSSGHKDSIVIFASCD
jgi:hypothetical protein